MHRRLMTASALALAVALTASLPAFANPSGQGSQTGSGSPAVTIGVQARAEALRLSIERLTAVQSLIPAEAQIQFEAAIQLLLDEAEVKGQVASNARAAEALVHLQAVAESEGMPAEAKAQIQGVIDELTATLNLTAETGTTKATLARAAAAARLQSMLEGEAFTGGQAAGQIETLVTKLSTELTSSGEAASEQEALAAIEAAVEGKANRNAAELDVQAEVESRLGKKEEARTTLKARLELNPHTRAAYEKLVALEAEAGEHQELDTFVRGKKVTYDVRPLIQENRTLVPIRALVDALGAEIAWNAETQVVTITKDGKSIELTIGSNIAKVDGVAVELDAPAQIVEGNRTVVPVRFVSQGLGLYVSWMAEQRTILVTEEPVAEE